jgi:tetratricopeptide (TPR) repeat protein
LSLSIPDIKAAAALDPLIGLIAYLSYSPQVSVEKLGPLFDEPAAFLDPQARPLAFILAYSYLSLGQSGPALEIIDFLNDPAQPDPRLTANRAWAIAQEGNLATAISLYTPLLDSPALPAADLHSTMGDLYAEAGQLEAAQTAYEAALLSDPQSPRPYLSLGRLALAQNQYNQALEFFSTALSLQPGYAIAYYERARLNVALGRLAEAASDAEQASTLEAYSGDYLALKAEVLALGGDSLGAIQLYERALRFDPQNAPAHLALARLYQSLGNVEGAARAAESALALSPNDPAAWLQRGQIHLAEGDFPTALNDFSQGLSYDPADSELKANLYVGRCAVYARLGDDGAAASDCDQALALSPRNGYALEQRGLIRHRAEDRAGAQSDFTEAITYEPAAYEAHYYLGLYALQEGRYDNAGQFLSRSLEIAPDYGLAYAARGVVYRLAGDWPAAIADLEQALALLPAEVYSFYELGLAKRGLADQLAEQGQAGPAYQRYQESERALLNFLNASDPAAEFVNEALAVLNYVRNALVALQNQTN